MKKSVDIDDQQYHPKKKSLSSQIIEHQHVPRHMNALVVINFPFPVVSTVIVLKRSFTLW